MQRVDENFFQQGVLGKMMGLQYSNSANYDTETRAQIRGLQVSLAQNKRTPEMMMILLMTADTNPIEFKWFAEPVTDNESREIMTSEWDGNMFIVPSTSAYKITEWLDRAQEQSTKYQCSIVLCIPASTNTAWFHEKVLDYARLLFIKGRLVFKNHTTQSRFPSLFAIYDATTHGQETPEVSDSGILKSGSVQLPKKRELTGMFMYQSATGSDDLEKSWAEMEDKKQ